MTVEGGQSHLATAELQLVERGVDDLPVEIERLVGGYAGQQVEQCGNGAAGGEYGNVLLAVGLFEQALEAAVYLLDETLPALQAGLVMLASDWVDGFSVDGFWSAMAFSLLYSTISSLLEGQWMLRVVRPHRRP